MLISTLVRIQDHGIAQKDVQYRKTQARPAFGQLCRPFYSKKNVADQTKATMFSALVMTCHVYNVHTWALATSTELDRWRNGIRAAIAQIARHKVRPLQAFHFSTEELCALMSVDSPGDLLHANRLRYAQRTAPAAIWASLHQTTGPSSWTSLLQISLLQHHHPGAFP